jgi:hypothetical protein
MNIRGSKNNGSEVEVQVIISDIRSEIDLDGLELLKLESEQPGTGVLCTNGNLWLTQQEDPDDHLLKAGQSFTINQQGIVLVQCLPCGKALILPPASNVNKPSYIKSDCSSQWGKPFEAE